MRPHPAIPTRSARLSLAPAAVLLLLLAGCDRETADLVGEINRAREGCTQEGLKARTEECVAMMERYAEMGTEVMHTTIGAVRSLDEALQRMPPASFDTVGLGPAIRIRAPLDSASAAGGGLAPSRPSFQRSPAAAARLSPGENGWEESHVEDGRRRPDPSGWRDAETGRYGADEFDEPRDAGGWGEAEPGYGAPYPRQGRPDAERGGWGSGPAEGGVDYPRPRDAGVERGRPAPPARSAPGVLLPPDERLDRPWLRDEPADEPVRRVRPRSR